MSINKSHIALCICQSLYCRLLIPFYRFNFTLLDTVSIIIKFAKTVLCFCIAIFRQWQQ